MPPVVGTTLKAETPLVCLSTVNHVSMRCVLTVSVARRNAISEVASTSARIATVATPCALVSTDTMRENVGALATLATAAPMVNISKRTERLAIAAPVLSFSVTEAVPVSPWHNVAAEFAALFTSAQVDAAAGVMLMSAAGIVAGVMVAVTTAVAAALSVTVKVTDVAALTLAGVNVNDAPLMAAVTGATAGLLDTTVNGPLPPVMPMVLGVLPNATNLVGPANSVLDTTGVDDELPPPQPDSANSTAEARALAVTVSLPKRV